MSIKIMLADDHILVRKAIRQLLETDENIEVVCEADDGLECMEKLRKSEEEFREIDLLILDIDMPGKNGIEVLREIRSLKWNIKVLILTGHVETGYFSEAARMGVDGYLLKNTELSTLQKAIETIWSGGTYIQSNLTEKMVQNHSLLTKRELEILAQVAGGRMNKEIADFLHISERTVKNHLSSLFKKIDVCDRTQAAVYAIRSGIVKLP